MYANVCKCQLFSVLIAKSWNIYRDRAMCPPGGQVHQYLKFTQEKVSIIQIEVGAEEDLYPKSCTFGYCVEKRLDSPGEMGVIIHQGG